MKKRFFLLPLCVLMSTLCFFASCNSGDENTIPPTLEDFTYKLSDDSTYYILTGVGIYSNSQLIIPSYYNNKPVKEIGENAFCNSSIFTSVTIPDTVEIISGPAFNSCDELLTVTIGSGIKSIGQGAFSNCSKLNSIDISSKNLAYRSIDGNLYSKDGRILIQYANGKSNEEFIIPNNVTTIGANAFANSIALEKIILGSNVETVSPYAFSNCIGLENVILCDNLKSIGPSSFYNCTGLTDIIIPINVEKIYFSVFQGCVRLKNIRFEDSNLWYRTQKENEFKNKDGGIETDVNSSELNAIYFKDTYKNCFWYKK